MNKQAIIKMNILFFPVDIFNVLQQERRAASSAGWRRRHNRVVDPTPPQYGTPF